MRRRQTIAKASMKLSGDDARAFLAAIMDDERIQKELNNNNLAPEMRGAIESEAISRDLSPGNYQI